MRGGEVSKQPIDSKHYSEMTKEECLETLDNIRANLYAGNMPTRSRWAFIIDVLIDFVQSHKEETEK